MDINTGAAQDANVFPVDQLPEKTRINVVENTASRAVIELQAGGPNGQSLGCLAVCWNALVITIGVVFIVEGNIDWPAILFLALFLAVGFGLAWFAARTKFTKTFILLEPDRLAMQKTLFGRKSTKTFLLDDSSVARLAQAYEVNREPVHRVDVVTVESKASFGLALTKEEKYWLVLGINRFLKADSKTAAAAVEVEEAPEKVVGTPANALDPIYVQDDDVVRIDRHTESELRLSWKSLPPGQLRTILQITVAILNIIAIAALAIFVLPQLLRAVRQQDTFAMLVATVQGLMVISVLLTAFVFSTVRTWVRLSDSQIELAIGPRLKQFRRSYELTDIESVVIADPEKSTLVKSTSNGNVKYIAPGCVIRIASIEKGPIPLSPGHSQATATTIGGLICWHLVRFGVQLAMNRNSRLSEWPRTQNL